MSGGPYDEDVDRPDEEGDAAPRRHEESLFGDPAAPPPPQQPPSTALMRPQPTEIEPTEIAPGLFGEIDPAAPPPDRRQIARGRAAQKSLDLHLRKVKRVKRFGLPLLILTVLFSAFVVLPVGWSLIYRFIDPPATLLMLQRAAEGERIRHYPIPLGEMGPHIVRAVIASEDANFCAHDGFDIEAIQGAMASNENGRRLRGASTISQQTAKNLFLWPSRSWLRKAFETYFTVIIETLWPKQRIMEAYLNAAEFGDGIFGVEAAAQERFGVSAARLTPLQAARLAAVLPSPNRYSATRPGPYVRRQAGRIMARARSVQASGAAVCVLAPR